MAVRVQANFTAGELSPALHARTDFAKYQTGAKKMFNFYCLPHGGVQNRPGTYFVAEVKDSSKRHRLIPFQFSTQQAYVLEFGELTIRIIKDDGLVLDTGVPVEVVTPYSESDLPDLYFAQSADVMYICHSDYYPRKLSRTSHTNWTLELAPLIDGPYKAQTLSDLDITLTPAARTGNNVAITASAAFFTAAMVGTPIRLGYINPNDSQETVWGYGIIDQVTDSTNARLDIQETFGFEYLGNSTFEVGLGFWEDLSGGNSLLTYDSVEKAAVLTQENTGYGDIRQEIGVTSNETVILTIVLAQEASGTLGANPLATVNGSTTVTVTHIAHGLNSSNQIVLAGVPGAVNGIPAVELNTTHTITYVDDDSYTITTTTSATSTGTGGGSAVTHQRAFGSVRIGVGTTTGGNDILAWQTETAPGTYSYTLTPAVSTVFVTIDGNGSADGNRSLINSVNFSRQQLGTADWRQSAWSSDNGYPKTVAFFEQRLTFAGTKTEPQTFWMTQPASESFAFSTPNADGDGLNYTMASQQVNGLAWLATLGELVAGTTGAEWRISSGSQANAISPTAISVKALSYFGSASIPPVVLGNSIIFAQRGGLQVRDLRYSLELGGYQGDDISILAEHLLDGYQIEEWTLARNPYSIIWSVRDDGLLLGLTYLKDQEVIGWHQHSTDGSFESVCAIPGTTIDDVYFIVNRTIGGATKRYIEKLMPRITDETTYDYYFVDCGLTYSGTAVSTFSGLGHLEGKTVVILADGAVIGGKVVTSGEVTISRASTLVHIGLPYNSDLELLPLEFNNDRGTSHGKNKTVSSINLYLRNSRGCWVGKDENNLDEITFSDEADAGLPPPLFTGIKEITPEFDNTKQQTIFIRQTYPLPLNILAVIPDVQTSPR